MVIRLEELIENLQWKADSKVVNDFDEYVWLRECFNSSGERIGIADCCFVCDPCPWHKALEKTSTRGPDIVN